MTSDWWPRTLRSGQTVELMIYGDRMFGRLQAFAGNLVDVAIPFWEQTQALQTSTVHGIAEISVEGGAARMAVSCWPAGDTVRMQVTGPVEFIQRRRYSRLDIDVPVVLSWPREKPGMWSRVATRTVDLSVGGLRVKSANTVWPSPGVAVTVAVDLPGGALHAQAEVIGKTPDYGLRLRFHDVPGEISDRIATFVEEPAAD